MSVLVDNSSILPFPTLFEKGEELSDKTLVLNCEIFHSLLTIQAFCGRFETSTLQSC